MIYENRSITEIVAETGGRSNSPKIIMIAELADRESFDS